MPTPRTFTLPQPAALRAFARPFTVTLDPFHEPCIVCGRKASGAIVAFLADTGEYITEAEMTDFDLGAYPVGSDCSRKLNAVGIPTYPL